MLLRPGEGRGGGGGAAPSPGQAVYQRECQVCHGTNRAGSENGTALVGVAARLDEAAIRTTMTAGKGRMPAFPHLTDADMNAVISFLSTPVAGAGPGRGRAAGPAPSLPPGPAVGAGGARTRTGAAPARGVPVPYPEGVPDTPRYVINEYGTIGIRMKPPFTTITKYDLNIPAIVWQGGLGDDPELAALGTTGTGMTQMRNGAVVTDTGLYFAPGGDNRIRAYDTANGQVLWTGHYGGTFRGAPIMYAVDGRQSLLVPAAGNRLPAGNQRAPRHAARASRIRGVRAAAGLTLTPIDRSRVRVCRPRGAQGRPAIAGSPAASEQPWGRRRRVMRERGLRTSRRYGCVLVPVWGPVPR